MVAVVLSASVASHVWSMSLLGTLTRSSGQLTQEQLIQNAYTWIPTHPEFTLKAVSSVVSTTYASAHASQTSSSVSTATRTQTTTISPTYVVFVDPEDPRIIKAKNSITGKIDFSGTDAATVIQNAIDALNSTRTSKEKVLLSGSFSISKTIKVPSYTILEIQGTLTPAPQAAKDGSTLGNAQYPLIQNADLALGNNDIEIRGGILDGGTTDIQHDAIHFNGVTNSTVQDISIMRFRGRGIVLGETTGGDSACQDIMISNCRFEHMGLEAIRTIVLSSLPATIGNKRIIITRCSFESNNEIPGDHYGAVHLDANTQDSLVDSCVFTNEKSAVEIDSAFRNIVSNSIIDTTSSSAIIVYQGTGPEEQTATLNHIIGNSIANAGLAGILIASDTAANLATQNTIENNTITNCNTRGGYPYGAIAVEGSPDNVIVGNIIEYTGSHGIVLFPADWRKCDRTQIARNRLSHCSGNGIELGDNAGRDITISNNYSTNNRYGVFIDSGNLNTRLVGNSLANNALGTIYDLGIGTQKG